MSSVPQMRELVAQADANRLALGIALRERRDCRVQGKPKPGGSQSPKELEMEELVSREAKT